MKRQMLAHRFAITYLPQKLEEHHQTTERGDRSLGLAQFHFFSAPKSGNFPVHCFVLLGVSFIQLKLNRVRAKQCYSISEFRINPIDAVGFTDFHPANLTVNSHSLDAVGRESHTGNSSWTRF